MTLSGGPEVLMIPGPTTVPNAVLRAMHRQALDIYAEPMIEVTERCLTRLKTVCRSDGDMYIYAANGHGAWEAALTNTLSRGDKILVLESGHFARAWGEMARMLGLDLEILPGSWRDAVDPADLEAFLRADSHGAIRAILAVQADTASGVVNDIPALRGAIDRAGHAALFMVDTIASLGCLPFEMDAWGVDVTVAASQKGLMTPPGLAFTAVGSRAKKAHATANLRTQYWDWTFRDGPEHYQKYCGTPPEQLLFGLDAALSLLLDEGLNATHARHALLAAAVRRAADHWAQGGAIEFNIRRPEERSDSVTVLRIANHAAQSLRAFLSEACGVVIGGAIGNLQGQGVRIGHMGHVNAPSVLGTLAAMDLGFKALAIPHGSGALEAATMELAVALTPSERQNRFTG